MQQQPIILSKILIRYPVVKVTILLSSIILVVAEMNFCSNVMPQAALSCCGHDCPEEKLV